ncbi:MAG: hypothetical protein KGP28_12005 [Bdellovibrionales bacterium]|nr:hypothetical protein [Bdellovibrionales bacterium]
MEKKVQNRNQGQALMEFVLGLMVIFSFFFFFIRMSALFAVSNYIHYATFMSARAFSSGSIDPEIRRERAREVLDATVTGKFKSLISAKDEPLIGGGPFFEANPVSDFWNQGVSFPFKAKLSLHPFTPKGQAIEMDLVSESWMPTSPTIQECNAEKASIQNAVGSAGVTGVIVEWDNGC